MGFKEQLKEKLRDSLSEEELSLLPRGFQILGTVIVLKLNSKLVKNKFLIGEKCLKIFPNFRSVYLNLGKVVGAFRKPEKIELIAGEDNPIVEHKEHDVIYRFDITKIIFSKGNINERKYLATLVRDGEIIVDMFAGIGYFSLPIARHAKPAKIYSIELNIESYNYLEKNVKLNHLEELIIPIHGDCKEEVIKLSKSGIKADRVIMGVFPAPKEYIKEALTLLKENGTTYHYEGIVERGNYLSLFQEFEDIANTKKIKCEILSKRYVKSYGPNLFHAVIDILASKN
ncbi:MAG: class I SAM-dependent methyltransferase family protein [Candidatus Hermodarchaeota archaeon]